MKRIIILMVLAILVLACGKEAWAEKDKFTDLDAQVDPLADDDVIPGVDTSDTTDDPAGSSVKITMDQIKTYIDALTSTDIGTTVQGCPAEGCFADGDKTIVDAALISTDIGTTVQGCLTEGCFGDTDKTHLDSTKIATQTITVSADPTTLTPVAGKLHQVFLVSGDADADADTNTELRFSEANLTEADRGSILEVEITDATNAYWWNDIDGNVETPNDKDVTAAPKSKVYFIVGTDRIYYLSGGFYNLVFNYWITTETENIPIEYAKDGTSAPEALATEDNLSYRNFSSSATEDIQFVWHAPLDLVTNAECTAEDKPYGCCTGSAAGTCNTIKVRPKAVVTNATAPADNEGVSWGISACSSGTNDTHDCTLGDEVYSEDADLDNDAGTQWDIINFPWVEVTPTGLARGEVVAIGVNRDHDNTDDDYGQDIGLFDLEIAYQRAHDIDYSGL